MKDLLSDIRLADEVRRYGENRAAAFKNLYAEGTIADLKGGDGDLLRNRLTLATEVTDHFGRASLIETRAFFARELPQPSFWRRTGEALKARFAFGGRR